MSPSDSTAEDRGSFTYEQGGASPSRPSRWAAPASRRMCLRTREGRGRQRAHDAGDYGSRQHGVRRHATRQVDGDGAPGRRRPGAQGDRPGRLQSASTPSATATYGCCRRSPTRWRGAGECAALRRDQRLLKETEQRNAELAVINAVQAALAGELDIRASTMRWATKLRRDLQRPRRRHPHLRPRDAQMLYPYLYEGGKRVTLAPHPPSIGATPRT